MTLPKWVAPYIDDIYRPTFRVYYPDKRVRTLFPEPTADYVEMAGRGGDYAVCYRSEPLQVVKICRYPKWGEATYTEDCRLYLNGDLVQEQLAFVDVRGAVTVRTDTSWGWVERTYYPSALLPALIQKVTAVNRTEASLSLRLAWDKQETTSVCRHTVGLADTEGKMLNDLDGDPERVLSPEGNATWYLVYYPAYGDLLVDCVLEGKKRFALVDECMQKGLTLKSGTEADCFLSHALLRGLEYVKYQEQFVYPTKERPTKELALSAWTIVSSGDKSAIAGLMGSLFALYGEGRKDEYLALAALTVGLDTDDTALYQVGQDCLKAAKPRKVEGLCALWQALHLSSVWAQRLGKTGEATDYAARAVQVERELDKKWVPTPWGGHYREGLTLSADTFFPLTTGTDKPLSGAFFKLYDGVANVRTRHSAKTTSEEAALLSMGLWADKEVKEALGGNLLSSYCHDRLLGVHSPYACQGLGSERGQDPYLNCQAVELLLKSLWGLTPTHDGLLVKPRSPTGRAMILRHLHYQGRVLTFSWYQRHLRVVDVFGSVCYDGPCPEGSAVKVPLDHNKRS